MKRFEGCSCRISEARARRLGRVAAQLAEPAAVSFGRPEWPHADDKPIEKKLTLHNESDEAVTLLDQRHEGRDRRTRQSLGDAGQRMPSGSRDEARSRSRVCT